MAHPRDFIDPVTGSWKCIGCGDCCQQIPVHPELVKLGFDRGDGVCKNLMPDRSCGIYETRPDSCRVDQSMHPLKLAEACAFASNIGIVSQDRWRKLQMGHRDYVKRDYTNTGSDPEVKIKKEGGDSASVNGGDSEGFGGGDRYSVTQTKGIEKKAPTSGSGGIEDEHGRGYRA